MTLQSGSIQLVHANLLSAEWGVDESTAIELSAHVYACDLQKSNSFVNNIRP